MIVSNKPALNLASQIREALQFESKVLIEFETGLQIKTTLEKVEYKNSEASFLKCIGPTAFFRSDLLVSGHDEDYHQQGFSAPLGKILSYDKPFSSLKKEEYQSIGIVKGTRTSVDFISGINLEGEVVDIILHGERLDIVTFKNCTIRDGDRILYKPSWGKFDLACVSEICNIRKI